VGGVACERSRVEDSEATLEKPQQNTRRKAALQKAVAERGDRQQRSL
jgi:hypothetical protein